jgi:hypothetical protein
MERDKEYKLKIIKMLEDLQYHIRYTNAEKKLDTSDIERRIRNIMGVIWKD